MGMFVRKMSITNEEFFKEDSVAYLYVKAEYDSGNVNDFSILDTNEVFEELFACGCQTVTAQKISAVQTVASLMSDELKHCLEEVALKGRVLRCELHDSGSDVFALQAYSYRKGYLIILLVRLPSISLAEKDKGKKIWGYPEYFFRINVEKTIVSASQILKNFNAEQEINVCSNFLSFFSEAKTKEAWQSNIQMCIKERKDLIIELPFMGAEFVRVRLAYEYVDDTEYLCISIWHKQDNDVRETYMTAEKDFFVKAGKIEGFWEFNIPEKKLNYSENLREIFAFPQNKPEGYIYDWMMLVHPNYLSEIMQDFNKYIQGNKGVYTSRYLLNYNNKYVRIYEIGLILSWTEEGLPKKALGALVNISDEQCKQI